LPSVALTPRGQRGTKPLDHHAHGHRSFRIETVGELTEASHGAGYQPYGLRVVVSIASREGMTQVVFDRGNGRGTRIPEDNSKLPQVTDDRLERLRNPPEDNVGSVRHSEA
jgi:hypothetical protein